VDSGSKDGTDVLAEQAGAKVIRIKQEEFTHSYSRMLGAQNATGEYLLFMTQDAVPDREDWVIRMLQPCLVSGAVAVSCYETPKADADLFCHISVHNWQAVMGGGKDKLTALPDTDNYEELRRNSHLSDNACLVNRSVFMEIGGHRGAYAEDLDLGYRLLKAGHKLGILSSIAVVHSHNRPPIYNFKRSIVDGIHIAAIFDSFSLEPIGIVEASSRLFGAVCANRMYLSALKKYNGNNESPEAFREWTRNEYNRNIIKLLNMTKDEIGALLLAEGDDLDPSVRSFTEDLWNTYSEDFKFYGVLAANQGRYIMHTVCPYLESIGATVNESMRQEISNLLWQYLGQSAGYGFAAAHLNPQENDPRLKVTIDKYTTGV
jgi:glycosyltransferase involved in cell wall biosynthesis